MQTMLSAHRHWLKLKSDQQTKMMLYKIRFYRLEKGCLVFIDETTYFFEAAKRKNIICAEELVRRDNALNDWRLFFFCEKINDWLPCRHCIKPRNKKRLWFGISQNEITREGF